MKPLSIKGALSWRGEKNQVIIADAPTFVFFQFTMRTLFIFNAFEFQWACVSATSEPCRVRIRSYTTPIGIPLFESNAETKLNNKSDASVLLEVITAYSFHTFLNFILFFHTFFFLFLMATKKFKKSLLHMWAKRTSKVSFRSIMQVLEDLVYLKFKLPHN